MFALSQNKNVSFVQYFLLNKCISTIPVWLLSDVNANLTVKICFREELKCTKKTFLNPLGNNCVMNADGMLNVKCIFCFIVGGHKS